MLDAEHWRYTRNPLLSMLIETHFVVTMFFVLSGFVFTLAGVGHHISYRRFMRNRLLRICPLYFALVLFGMAVFPERTNWNGFVGTFTAFANTHMSLNFFPISATFWTVAIELQFYLLFPLLMTVLNREGPRPLVCIVLLSVGLRLCGFWLGASIRDINYWHLLGRIDAFLFGMLLAWGYRKYRLQRISVWSVLPALMALFGMTFTLNHLGGWPVQVWWRTLWPTLEAAVCCLFVWAYLPASHRMPRVLSRVLTGLGELSFAVYLMHMAVLHALVRQGIFFDLWPSLPTWDALANTLLVVLPCTLALAALAYFGIEAPFMRMRGRYVLPPQQRPSNPAFAPEPARAGQVSLPDVNVRPAP